MHLKHHSETVNHDEQKNPNQREQSRLVTTGEGEK